MLKLPRILPAGKFKNPVPKPWRRAFAIVSGLVLLVGIPGAYFALRTPSDAEAAWFDSNWSYRQIATITNNSGSAQTNFQVKLTVSTSTLITASKMQSSCADLRFTDNQGEELQYWIETGTDACNTTTTAVWVKVPNLPTGTSKIHMYYGNLLAPAGQNGKQTFDFFDDFSGNALNSDLWDSSGGAFTVTGGELTITTGSLFTKAPATSTNVNYLFETRVKWASTQVNYAGLTLSDANNVQGGNVGSNKMAMMVSNTSTSIANQAYAADGTAPTYNVVSNVTQFTPTAATYTFTGMGFDATASATLHFQGARVQTGAYTDTAVFSPYVILGLFTGSIAGSADTTDQTVDFVLGRKYASTEPTASFASEEVGAGPVGYYKFNDGQGQTASDSSRVNNVATLGANATASTDDPVWQNAGNCVSDKCLLFDGTNDQVRVPANAAINPTEAGSFSVGAWVRPGKTGSLQYILNKQIATTNMIAYALSINASNQAVFSMTKHNTTTNSATSTQTLTQDQWYYLSGTYDGTNIILYINGIQAASTTRSFTSSTQNTSVLYIGSLYTGASYFQGSIDEVKIYPYVRTAAQQKSDYIQGATTIGSSAVLGIPQQSALTNGLVGHWKMDEASWTIDCSTTSVLDSSGTGNNARACPTTTGPAGGGGGKFGNGGAFDGSNDYVNIGNATSLQTFSKLTYSAWIYPTTLNAGTLYVTYSKDTAGFYVGVFDGKIRFRSSDLTSDITEGTTSISLNTWHHMAVTYDGATVNLYLDGKLDGSEAATGTISDNSANAIIGSFDGSSEFFTGRIDETRIYNRAMSVPEISQLYNFAPAPIGYWPFEENFGLRTKDYSGNENFGSLINGPVWTAGKYGGGLNFDGSNDYVNVVHNANTSVGKTTDNYTIEAWVKGGGPNGWIVEKGQGAFGDGNVSYGLNVNASSQVIFVIYDGGAAPFAGASAATVLPTGVWTHVAGVRDADNDQLRLYMNGVLVATGTDTTTATAVTTTNMAFGNNGGGHTEPYTGGIDEVRLYNYARTPGQIIEDMNALHPLAGNSPVGSQALYWNMDELQGTTINNKSQISTAATGTMTGAVWQTNSTCKVNGCLNFDTNTDKVSAGDVSFVDGINGITATTWINPTTLSSTSELFGKWNSSSQSNFLVTTASANDEIIVYIASSAADSGSNYCTTTNLDLAAGTWQHIAIVYDGTQANADRVKVYKNGRAASCTVTGTIPTTLTSGTTSSLILGNTDLNTYTALLAKYDEFKIYAEHLTADQVGIDFNQGKALNFNIGTGLESAQLPGGTGTDPIAYWNMEENTGSSLLDRSGNSNTGTTTAGTYGPGKFGAGLVFNGTTTTSSIANESNFDFERTDSFSQSYWVRPNVTRSGAATAYKTVSKRDSGGTTPGWESTLYWDGSSKTIVRFNLVNSTLNYIQVDGSIDVPNNVWSHITVTYSGTSNASGVKIYVNGILNSNTIVANSLSASTLHNANLYLGSMTGSSQYYIGSMDEVKIYNYVRAQDQVMYDYNRGQPIGFWKLNECQGLTANDSSGYGNAGTLSIGASGTYTSAGTCGSGTSTEAWNAGTTGKYNGSLGFDGSNDTVNLGNNYNFTQSDPFSVSAWIKTTNNNGMSIVAKQNTSAPFEGWNIQTGGSGYLYFQFVNSYCSGSNCIEVRAAYDTKYYDGNWHHFAATYDGSGNASGVVLYLDGKVLPNLTYVGSLTSSPLNSLNTYIGSRNNVNQFFVGQIDEVRIHNYVIGAEQVRKIYNNDTTAFYGPATGSP